MGKYQFGQCVPLNVDGDLILCEILGYKGSGYYNVNLTRGLVDTNSRKFPPMATVHQSVLDDLAVQLD